MKFYSIDKSHQMTSLINFLLYFLLFISHISNANSKILKFGQGPYQDLAIPVGKGISGQLKSNNMNQTFVILEITNSTSMSDQQKYLSLNVAVQNKQQNLYLELRLQLLEIRDDNDNHMHLEDSLQSVTLRQCKQPIQNSCFFPASRLTENSLIKVIIKASHECNFFLFTSWFKIESLIFSNFTDQEKKRGQKQIVNYYIFKDQQRTKISKLQLPELNFNEIRLLLKQNDNNISSMVINKQNRIKMFVGLSQLPTTQFYQFSSFEIKVTQNTYQQLLIINSQSIPKNITKKAKILYILMIFDGNLKNSYAQRVFQVTMDIRQNFSLQLNSIFHDSLLTDQQKRYTVQVPDNRSKNATFQLKINVRYGKIAIKIFKDPNLNELLESKPFDYLGDTSFFFPAEEMERLKISKLYISIKGYQHQCLFSMVFREQSMEQANKLEQGEYEFIQVRGKRILYYQIRSNTQEQINHEYSIGVVYRLGQVTHRFYLCRAALQQCVDQKTLYPNSIQISKSFEDQIGKVHLIKINIHKNKLSQDHNYIIIRIQTKSPEKIAVLTINFNDNHKMHLLSPQKPFEGHINQGQSLIFKVRHQQATTTNSMPLQFKVVLNIQSGNITMEGYDTDPLKQLQTTNLSSIKANKDIVEFKNDLFKDKYIVLLGQTEAIFMISVQLIHGLMEQNRLTKQVSNLIIKDDIWYDLQIGPFTTTIIEIYSMYQFASLKYKSSSTISICQINLATSECVSQKQISKRGLIQLNNIKEPINRSSPFFTNNLKDDLLSSYTHYARIQNPSQDKISLVSLLTISTIEKICLKSKLNKVEYAVIKNGQCFNFQVLNTKQDLDLTFSLNQLGNVKLQGILCDSPFPIHDSHFTITKEQIAKSCNESYWQSRPKNLSIAISTIEKIDELVKITYLVQTKNNIKQLIDGISHTGDGFCRNNDYFDAFQFLPVNLKNATINIQSFKVKLNMKGFITSQVFNEQQLKNITHNMPENARSSSMNFYNNAVIEFSEKDWQRSKCISNGSRCSIIVLIFCDNSVPEHEIAKYNIEITQNTILMSDHRTYPRFLHENSTLQFQFEIKQSNSTLVVNIADFKRNCAKTYVSSTEDYISTKLFNGIKNQIAVQITKAGTYFITVQAIKDCPFSIAASVSLFRLENILPGVPSHINLKKNEEIYYLYESSKTYFKIFLIAKYGDIKIYANQSNERVLNHITMKNKLQVQSFQFSNSYQNSLIVNLNSSSAQESQNFIIVVQASQRTQGEILLTTNQDPIKLFINTTLYDILSTESNSPISAQTCLHLYHIKKGILIITLFSQNASLKATITYKNQQIQLQFKGGQVGESISRQFYISQQQQYGYSYNWDPIKIIIKNTNSQGKICSYKLIAHKIQVQPSIQVIKKGFPQFVFIHQEKKQCLSGYFTQQIQKLILTVDKILTPLLHKLQIQTMIDNKLVIASVTQAENVKELLFNLSKYEIREGIQYTTCFKSNKEFDLIIIQIGIINLLPKNTQILVKNMGQFILHPERAFIIDIFQCQGNTQLKFSQNIEDLNKQDKIDRVQSLFNRQNQFIQQPHATLIQNFGTSFLKINGPSQKVNWIQVDQKNQRGMGYHYYMAGDIEYFSSFKQLRISWDPIHLNPRINRKVGTKIQKITYRIVIGESKQSVKELRNCRTSSTQKIIEKVIQQEYKDKGLMKFITIEKKQIIEKLNFQQQRKLQKEFDGNLYITISAQVQLFTPSSQQYNDNIENYRFVYDIQDVPKSLLYDTKTQIVYLIVMLAGMGIIVASILLAISYLIIRIGSIISRLKTRAMVEQQASLQKQEKNENQKQIEKQQIELPMPTAQRMIARSKQ